MEARAGQPDPKLLSMEELARRGASSRVEELLQRGGWIGAIVALPLMLVVLIVIGSAARPFFMGLVLVLAAIFWASDRLSRPKRRYRDELALRRGDAPLESYMDDARVTLDRGEADWVLLLTIAALPHGDHRWLRLELRGGPPPSARAELRVSGAKGARFERVEGEVPADIVQDLSAVLEDLDMDRLTDVPSLVIDGARCRLAVLRREPRRVASASCNLSGMRADELRHPTAFLCSMLAEIARGL